VVVDEQSQFCDADAANGWDLKKECRVAVTEA
jgi:hypothetical protein